MSKKIKTEAVAHSGGVDRDEAVVEIDGKSYTLTFNFHKLVEAETHFKREGRRVNLLFSLCSQTLKGVEDSFPCLVYEHHKLGWEEAQALVNIVSAYSILVEIAAVYDRQTGGNAKAEASQ